MKRHAFFHAMNALLATAALHAGTLQLYFGTWGQGGSLGVYHATFNPDTGEISSPNLATKLDAPGFLALHPSTNILYAVAAGPTEPGVAAFRIQPTGELESLGCFPTTRGVPAHIAVHPSGKFLLTAQYGTGSVALFPLDSEGNPGTPTLYQHEGGTRKVDRRQDSPHPHWCGFSPDGNFALIPDLGLDGIVIYRIDHETSTLIPHSFAASEPGGGARHMRFSPDGKFIHLVNELTSTLSTFSWDASEGTATLLSTVPALDAEAMKAEAMNAAAEILVHPSGNFIYYSNRGNDSVSVFNTTADPSLPEVTQVHPIRGAFPRHIALSPCSRWLLAAGADSNTVSVHRVDPETGKLTYQTKRVVNVPNPICILFVETK